MVVVLATLVSAGLLCAWLRFAFMLRGITALPDLARGPVPADGERVWPRLSAVVACRDEAAGVEAAMRSLLAQDYPDFEVVAVDDRSADGTGEILDALAAKHRALRVVHVDTLPDGWLGKTHALSCGAARATGAWLLFTDADIVFAPDALRRTVAWAEREHLGHAVALPQFVAPGLLERAFVAFFALVFHLRFPVRDLARAGSDAYIGIGAFNLVRRADYQAVGGHERLRLEVVDDVKLGMVLRRSGVRQGCADSGGIVRVRWQRGFVASMAGLVKNFFAACEYSWLTTLRAALSLPFATVGPFVLAAFGPTPLVRVLAGAAAALSVAALGYTARRSAGGRGYEGLLVPVAGLCLAGVALASAVVTTARRGVVWRGTRYPLALLAAACVRDRDWPVGKAAPHLPRSQSPG